MSALVSPDGVAPSRMLCVSASVNLPLRPKVQKFSSGTGTGLPGWSRKKGRKTVVVWWWFVKRFALCYQTVVCSVCLSCSVCWPDCKPEALLFSAEFVCLCVCVCVSLTGTSTLQH